MTPRERVRAALDHVVKAVVDRGCPVEMTHKAGHKPDFIPDDGWEIRTHDDVEEAIAWLLVGGWTSKHALIEVLRAARAQAVAEERERCAKIADPLHNIMDIRTSATFGPEATLQDAYNLACVARANAIAKAIRGDFS